MCLGSCEAVTTLGGNPSRGSAQGRKKENMKRILSTFVCGLFTVSLAAQQSQVPAQNVLHIATALNHLTVLEFHEPVTMAAAGSSDFQIERQDNKVFVKPMKPGVSTDLLVWTASRRFAYELEITQEVKNMNFAIDTAQPALAQAPKPVVETDPDQFADMVLTRALLGAEEIKQKSQGKAKGQVSVLVEQVFRRLNTVYVHYAIKNNSGLFYRPNTPQAYQLQPYESPIPLATLAHT